MKNLMRTLLPALAFWAAFLPVAAQRHVGGDVSLLKAYEDKGVAYVDQDGNATGALLPYLKNACGMNTMRVRLFHNPANASSEARGQGVFQDLDYVKALGKEIKDAGLDFLLDFHYSDTWADPSNQWTPQAWLNLTDAALEDSVYNYTAQSLQALVAAGATPDFIQIGNEVSYGFLWGQQGGASPKRYYAGQSTNRVRFTRLLSRAAAACRAVCPRAKIILHTERVANPAYLVQFYRDMDDAGVDYDIIGTSYYSYYHGFLPQLSTALRAIEAYSLKDIMVVETGYYHAWQPASVDFDYSATFPVSADGQKAFTQALIDTLAHHPRVTGLFWWEMETNDGEGSAWNAQHVLNGWYNAGLVDNATGRLLPAAYVMKDFLGTPTGMRPATAARPASEAGHGWYTPQGVALPTSPAATSTPPGLYIHQGRKVVVK